jgi:toxin HigB-1
MIRSFADATTESVYNGLCPKGFPQALLKVARRKLRIVDAAAALKDLEVPPGNKLHPLLKDRLGQHAIRINDKYRVCFKWHEGDAYDVEITDYH